MIIFPGSTHGRACKVAMNPEARSAAVMAAALPSRNVTAGQRAMAYARIYPELGTGGRGNKLPKFGEFPGVISQRVSDARLILQWTPDLADAVLNGVLLALFVLRSLALVLGLRARDGGSGCGAGEATCRICGRWLLGALGFIGLVPSVCRICGSDISIYR
jgi:hypothetical protein